LGVLQAANWRKSGWEIWLGSKKFWIDLSLDNSVSLSKHQIQSLIVEIRINESELACALMIVCFLVAMVVVVPLPVTHTRTP
jgi:hypothetical protein